jgi:hypothetical protein
MTEVAQLYSDRMHRNCADDAVFNCWMLTNLQSDDAYIPATALHLLRGLAGLSEEDGRVGIELWAMDAENVLKEQVN